MLGPKLQHSVVSECFSQTRDELIMRFEIGPESFVIRASLTPELSCLSFPGNFHRARKNSVDLFPSIIGRKVGGIKQFDNERSFALQLSEEHDVLFKMHGNRTNLILFQNGAVADLFRKKISGDASLKPDALDREIDWSFEHFLAHADELKSLYFTFGKIVWQYLEHRGFRVKSLEEQWADIQAVRKTLENPGYYITYIQEKPVLSLLPVGNVVKELHDPIAASNEFFYAFTQQYVFSKERSKLLSALRTALVAGENYCKKNLQRLEEVKQDDQYRLWADLIMANLHTIKGGEEKVVVPNYFKDDQGDEEIKLKKDITPQKNAELYYRKAKNQHIEIARLETSIAQKQEEMKELRHQIATVENTVDLKSLRAIRLTVRPEQEKNISGPVPYHEFEFKGYRILVGKNAQANDTLTSKYSHKEDLWLHAKDVSGSHVLIKHQSGKNFPKDVIEYAASLAAYNSKRRNESLCPVIVTPRKFVRKRKGDAPGAVVVEREEVIMVEPFRIN